MKQVLFKSESVEWPTPKAVYDQLNSEFGFNFDPCPLGGSDNGLSTLFSDWKGKRVFCNPPYGPGIRDWLRRGLDAELAVYLIPARTDTRWFHELVLPFAKEIRFIKGRLKFGDAVNSAPFPSMLVVYRGEPSIAGADSPRGVEGSDNPGLPSLTENAGWNPVPCTTNEAIQIEGRDPV